MNWTVFVFNCIPFIVQSTQKIVIQDFLHITCYIFSYSLIFTIKSIDFDRRLCCYFWYFISKTELEKVCQTVHTHIYIYTLFACNVNYKKWTNEQVKNLTQLKHKMI